MKLFTQYNRINLLAIISIFLLASIAYYYLINYVVLAQIDDDLRIKKNEIKVYTKEHLRLPESLPVGDQIINYSPTNHPLKHVSFRSLTLYDSLENDKNLFRQLIFTLNINGQWYKVEVSKSLEHIGSLIHSILLISLITILLILTVSVLINRLVLKSLWKPFYETLHLIQSFKIKIPDVIQFKNTKIDEFDFMNQTLAKTMNLARSEYIILKEFTENASHEMQTPLAVIRSKLDLLIQDETITEEQSYTLQSTYYAIQKLTKLNQSLLLLAKIENRQYEKIDQINLKIELEEKIEEFKELWQAQEIVVNSSSVEAYVNMNKELADILLNNLLSNATRHNFQGGIIKLELKKSRLSISNTSNHKQLDKNLLFTRFYKPSQEFVYNGLGLSIIKQICDASELKVNYSYIEKMHKFEINL
ncbi:MAG: hypothetical protein NVS1B13_07650 [Flavisolibacter sp.]